MATKKQAKIKLTVWHKGGYRDKDGQHYTEAQANKMFQKGEAVRTEWKTTNREARTPGPGRKEKIPNLVKVEGGYKNRHGVTFTEAQKKELEKSVRRSNYLRNKQLAESDQLRPGHRFGVESDFIIARQSRSLQGFKSMEEYNSFMDKQARIQSGEHLDDRTRLYKHNHMEALKNVFGDDAKDVIMKIRMMPLSEYREKLQKDELLEVNFIYDPSAMAGKLNQIRKSLGMKEKEIPM